MGSRPNCCRRSSTCSCRAIARSIARRAAWGSAWRWSSGWWRCTAAQVIARSAGLDKGSTFEIRLPLIDAPGSRREQPAQRQCPPQRILIVDDNVDAADRWRCCCAGGPRDPGRLQLRGGARASAVVPPGCGAAGYRPAGDGWLRGGEACASCPDSAQMRLIALTGYGQAEDQARTQAAGFDDSSDEAGRIRRSSRPWLGLYPLKGNDEPSDRRQTRELRDHAGIEPS